MSWQSYVEIFRFQPVHTAVGEHKEFYPRTRWKSPRKHRNRFQTLPIVCFSRFTAAPTVSTNRFPVTFAAHEKWDSSVKIPANSQ